MVDRAGNAVHARRNEDAAMLRLLDRFRPASVPAPGRGADFSDLMRRAAADDMSGPGFDTELGAEKELARIVALARDLER
ncbi:hypothetical protein AL035_19660 [Salipiger aestuarii]|uniref:Uncharacterized protein n=2 Tax=Salipiger aestuarii TaxID=568098 RepID=A0A327XWH8_9RHOB|nr:hypothetical protein AL035_19660 [Salipiger aestuarii]RAK10409.1 hypothetical protein ATI53_105811 [Salipiger aestuarii]